MRDEANQITVDRSERVALVTLNRPAKLNAIDPATLARLEAVLADLDVDEQVRVVILTGAGDRAFSVGADINAWAELSPLDMWRRWIREGHRVFERLARLRQPTIAAINGLAFGGGLELAMAADLRLAADTAAFAMPEVTLGTVPGWGGTSHLATLIGPSRAKQLVFSGARVDADTAERWGLVNEVVLAADLLDRCRSVAGTIAANAPVAVQLAKLALDGAAGQRPEAALEALAGALAGTTNDAREGLAAFREKRSAVYEGR